MTAETHFEIANFIWSICNLLRGPYKRNEYRKVILPLTVLRRFDCILTPTKADVLKEHAKLKGKPENIIRHKLSQITKHSFYNLSKLDLPRLLDDPNQLAPNLNSYINGFSPNVRAIMERFDFGTQIARMNEKDLLYLVIKKFASIDLSTSRVDSVQMGYVFEEPGMNSDCVSGRPISEKQLAERFASPDYQLLLVANKYQTGFDQPLLQAMYVDKRLDGVQAVQTLSRLNRKIPGKENPFVLDFVNEAEDIYRAFKPYYDATSLEKTSDPQQLERLKHELDAAQVYFWSEVEAFARIFYRMPEEQKAADHAHMQRHLQPAVDRFKTMEDEEKRSEFREKLKAYVSIYSFLSQVIPYGDPDLEILYSYGRFLLPHLPLDRDTVRVKLGDEVELEYYRLQRIYSGEIALNEGEPEGVRSPTEVGTGKAKDEKVPLSEIIQILNERFATKFTEEDRLFFDQIREKASRDPQVIQTALANPLDKFQLGIRNLIEEFMVQRMGENDKIVARYMDDPEFQSAAFPILARAIFETVRMKDQENPSKDGIVE